MQDPIFIEKIIRKKIFTIRGKQVMLDSDLAELYGVPTKVINQAVKRNIERFPEDFMFQITKKETSCKGVNLEVTICDFKLGWKKKTYLCIHRTRCSYAFFCAE